MDMDTRIGMKSPQRARTNARKAWGIMRSGRLLPETFAIKLSAKHSARRGDQVVPVEICVVHE